MSFSRNLFLFFLGLIFSYTIYPQSRKDDLVKRLDESKNASDSIEALIGLADWYLYNSIDTSLYYLEIAGNLAHKEKNCIALSSYHRILGKYYSEELGETLKGRKEFKKSENYADSCEDRLSRELIYTELGYNYRQSGQLDSSNLYFSKMMRVLEPGDSIGQAIGYNGMGLNYRSVGATDKSAESFFQVLKLIGKNYNYQSVIYYNLRLLYEGQENYADAEKYARLGVKAAEKGTSKFNLGNAKQALGLVLLKIGKYDSAEYYIRESIKIAEELNTQVLAINGKTYLANLQMEKGNWKGAGELIEDIIKTSPQDRIFTSVSLNEAWIAYLLNKPNPEPEKALKIIEDLEARVDSATLLDLKNNILMAKSRIYEKIDPAKALLFYKQYDSLENKVNSENLKQYTTLLETEYETEKKNQEIQNLIQQAKIQALEIKQRNNQLLIGGLAFLFLTMGGLLYYRNYRYSKEKEQAELEQRFLRSQLNPHFIFNSMTSIQNYLITNKDADLASHYMGMFSSLMRQILENSRQEYISLGEEVKMLKNYLELQKLRFPKGFEYNLTIDEDLDYEYHGIPPMFAQPFIENSLEHGLFKEENRTNQITIKFHHLDENLVKLIVEDSGIGLVNSHSKKNHNSLATRITEERFQSLRFSKKHKVGMTAENIVDENGYVQGYRVILKLPSKTLIPE